MRSRHRFRRARVVAASLVALVAGRVPGVVATPPPAPPAGSPATFSFGAAGDFGTTAAMGATLGAVARSGTDFFLGLGDLSYNPPGTEPAWCDAVTAVVGPAYPFEIVSGNHDQDAIDGFTGCMPNRLSGLQGTYGKEYFFDYPPAAPLARVVMISPDLTFSGEPTYSYAAGTAHSDWLVHAIDDARAAGIPWVVVGMHEHCLGLVHPCEIGGDLLNLLVAEKVDLVLQGHDHAYLRSAQLALGPSCPAVPAPAFAGDCVVNDGQSGVYHKGDGPVTVISGTGGESLYSVDTAAPAAPYMARMMSGNVDPTFGFVRYSVTATSLSARFVAAAGGGFTDSFTISSDPPAPVTAALAGGLVGGALSVATDGAGTDGAFVRFPGPAPKDTDPGVRITGNRLRRAGAPFVPVGFTVIGALAPAGADAPDAAGTAARHLDDATMAAALAWGANTIRFQVSQPGLDPLDPLWTAAYLDRVTAAVALARAHGLAVILSMQDQELGGGTRHPQPSDATVRAWQALAPRFNGDPDVLYELFNEPQNQPDPRGWTVWRDGGPPEGNQGTPAVGHQAVLDAVRATGARNVVLADGARYAQRLDGLPLLHDPLGQVAYAVHPYLIAALRGPSTWSSAFGELANRFPVVATEWDAASASPFCQPEWPTTGPQLLDFLQTRGIGILGWAFDSVGSLVSDWAHDPTTFAGFACGQPGRDAGQALQSRMAGWAAQPPPPCSARSDEHAVAVTVDIPTSGVYQLWTLARSATPDAALAVRVDGACPARAWATPLGPSAGWNWLTGPTATLNLTAGRHTLRFVDRGGAVDAACITLQPVMPGTPPKAAGGAPQGGCPS